MKNNSKKNNEGGVFWDRQVELKLLRDWAAGNPRLAVLHGRRRLGKTALLRQWLQGAGGCYVQATEGTPALQRANLSADLGAMLPGFGEATYPTWRALLEALQRQWSADIAVLVLDEFPYLAQSAPELPSLVQAMVDGSGAGCVPLTLCGSSQRMMQGLVLNADAPLFGRAQVLLRLQPLPAGDIRNALDLPDAAAAVETYAAFGGVPRYWELMHAGGYTSATAALEDLVFSPTGVLHDEADRVLRDEEAAALERAACELIGHGAHRPSELCARLGVKETTISKPLRHLADLGLVERQAPYDFRQGRPVEGGRRVLYKLADPFLAMWYACVRPYLSGLNVGAGSARRHALKAWKHHLAAVWESLCRRQWHEMKFRGIEWEAAGRYWAGREPAESEWDVVSISADRQRVFLGECKWMRSLKPAKAAEFARAIARRATPPLPDGVEVHRGLFLPSREGLGEAIDGVTLWDAENVMK